MVGIAARFFRAGRGVLRLAALLLVICAPAGLVRAEEASMAGEGAAPEALIAALLIEEPALEGRFAAAFLEQVPLAQIASLLGQIRATIGPVEAVSPEGAGYVVETRTHTMPVEIVLDGEGRIAGLLFRAPVQKDASLAGIAASLGEIEGEVAYLVVRDGEVLAEAGADAPLAVGSAFKLGVLALLEEAVARGERAWDDVVRLETRHVSLPTGIMQTFPVGSPITLHTAAVLMISISDNTATDLLIDVVGRAALAERLGVDFALTTREFFFLKGDLATRERFLAAGPEEKLAIAADIAGRPLPALNPNLPLHDEGVEWYVPARRLCELIGSVAHLDVMGINPGLARPADWARIAFKGGSETGVLNMTTHLRDAEGVESCVVMTINAGRAIQATTPTTIYASLLAALAEGAL